MTEKQPVITLASEPRGPDGIFPEVHNGLYLGGHLRMTAAVQLARDNPLVLTGGFNMNGDLDISDKVDTMEEFIREVVPDADLTCIPSLPCTRHNFVAVFNTLALTGRLTEEIFILSSAWHLPRAEMQAQRVWIALGYTMRLRVRLIAAEDIIGPPIRDVIAAVHPQEYQARLIYEENKRREIQDGTYQDSCLGRRFNSLQYIIGKHPDTLLTSYEREVLGFAGDSN